MKIVFMGTPDFARDSLEAIYKKGHTILGVVTNPDKPKGRGMKLISSPVKEFALENNLKVFQPEKVRGNEEFIQEIKNLNPDVVCVVAYGKILPKDILDIPKYGCINVHGSLLPKYRGAAPIQWAILNGEKETGVTTMYMDIGMDTGDMILKEQVEIQENETTGELWGRLSQIGSKLLVETLDKIEQGNAPRIPQGKEFTLAPMLSKNIGHIQWDQKTSKQIRDLVRGLDPIMGAYCFYQDKKMKIWKVEIFPYQQTNNETLPGQILMADSKQGLVIKTIDGAIAILEIQGENAKRMKIEDFLRGTKLETNVILK